jgi:hypothetical protein
MSKENKFGTLQLTVEGTNNGRGFDIMYDFGKSFDFGEFTSKERFSFIQPWMQFPSNEYTDTCKLVSIELVKRFNGYEDLEKQNKHLITLLDKYKNTPIKE